MRYQHGVGLIAPYAQKHIKQLVLALAAIFIATMAMLTAISSAAANSVVTTDLSTWDLTETRSAGHQVITPAGLHVYTDDNSSNAKAAAYYNAADFDLENANDWSLNWVGTLPAPGGQLKVDLDGDGDIDGILVVEDVYGGIGGMIWLPSLYDAAGSNASLVASLPHEIGGGGYPNQGTLATWNTQFPNAKVLSIGYSLGSGILGDGVISKITANDTDYTFEPETVAPTADLVFPVPGPASNYFDVVFSEPVQVADAENAANYYLNNWPGAGGTGDLAGDATVVYNSVTKTARVTFTNPGWYISAEQEWRVYNVRDLAGNVIAPNPTSEFSTPMVAPLAPGTPTAPSSLFGTSQTWTWTAATDPGGVNASGVARYEVRVDGGAWVNVGNVLTYNTNFTSGTHTLSVRAIDNAGNVGATSTGSVTVFTDKEQCKDGGWALLGSTFKNQGDCVSFFATKGKNQPASVAPNNSKK